MCVCVLACMFVCEVRSCKYLNPTIDVTCTYACILYSAKHVHCIVYMYCGSGWLVRLNFLCLGCLCVIYLHSLHKLKIYLPAVPCGIPYPPINGSIEEFNTTEVVYRCDIGFSPPTEMTATCEPGNWSPTPPADLMCTQTATGTITQGSGVVK